jgi:hypothetical protein
MIMRQRIVVLGALQTQTHTVQAGLEPTLATWTGTQHGQPRNLRDWPIDSLGKRVSSLKCRCHQFQILSRGLTLASSGQDYLHEPTPILSIVGVKHCRLVGLNTLQGARKQVLVVSWRMRCKATKTDNSQSNQGCRDQAYGDLDLELFHKRGLVKAL